MSSALSNKIPKNKKVIDWFKVDEKVAYATTQTEFIVIDNDVVDFFNFSNVKNVIKNPNNIAFTYNNINYNFRVNSNIINRFPANVPAKTVVKQIIKPDIELQSKPVNAEYEKVKSELQSTTEELSSKTKELNEIKNGVKLYREKYEALETKSNLYKETYEDIKVKLSDSSNELLSKNNELLLIRTGLESVVAELNSTKSELTSTKSELNSTKSELTSTKSELTSTKSELTSTKSELTSTKSELTSTKSELTSTKSELTSTKSDALALYEKLKLENNFMVNNIESLKAQANSIKEENDNKLKLAINELNQARDENNKAVKESAEYISLLEYKLKIMKTEITEDIEIKGISKDEAKEVVKKIINQVKTLLIN